MTVLTYLSLQRVTAHTRPRSPSNDERIKAYRAYQPVQLANAPLTERIRAAEYARAETLDGRYPTTDTHGSTK